MQTDNLLKTVNRLEKELYQVRGQILEEEKQIFLLEKRLFEAEKTLENNLLTEFGKLRVMETRTEQDTKLAKKLLAQKIQKLLSKTNVQKLSNAMAEREVLQRELLALQARFDKVLKQAKE